MSRIELAPEVADDFERIFDHLFSSQSEQPEQHLRQIMEAIDVLEYNPLIGRPSAGGMRELVIGHRRSHGYLALYRYLPGIDTVLVLAIRSQREAGYVERVAGRILKA